MNTAVALSVQSAYKTFGGSSPRSFWPRSTGSIPPTIAVNRISFDVLAVQRLINRVSVEASFFKKLSPMENLLYGARLYGLNGSEARATAATILTRLGLQSKSFVRPMEEMSRGMQQKVAIARALLSHRTRSAFEARGASLCA